MVSTETAEVDGLEVFYRQAGDPANPKLLLLGGFPASSHQVVARTDAKAVEPAGSPR